VTLRRRKKIFSVIFVVSTKRIAFIGWLELAGSADNYHWSLSPY